MSVAETPYSLISLSKIEKEYGRDNIEEFVDDYTLSDDEVEEFKKIHRLESICRKFSTVFFFLAVVSFLAGILVPVFATLTGIVFSLVNYPDLFANYLGATSNIGLDVILVVGSIFILSVVLGLTFDNIGDTFSGYKNETGLNEFALEGQKLAKSYEAIDSGEYREGIEYLEEYNDRYQYRVEDYIGSAQPSGNIDEEFIEETYVDFFGLLLERLSSQNNHPDELKVLTNRFETDYYSEDASIPENREDEHIDTYRGIIFRAIKNFLSSGFRGIISFAFNRPWAIYIVFLIIGIGVSRINSTLAVVTATILTGGFESWRRSKQSGSVENEQYSEPQ